MPHLIPRELQALLVLNRLLPGSVPIRQRLEEGIAPSEILEDIQSGHFLNHAEKLRILKSKFNAEREFHECHRLNIQLIPLTDESYPKLLRQIPDPPFILYILGQLDKTDEASLAIVGSRHPSLYGIRQTKLFSKSLAEKGWTIVSGLARGIDETAHRAALEIPYGRSLAILGCGVNQVYPKSNESLYHELIERGAVISEYPLDTQPLAHHFPRRNRIISGLCLATLVIEAHSRSGTLITAREALDQGRDVFALPGPVDQLTSRGTHRLIKEGAALVETTEDILEALSFQIKPVIQSIQRKEVKSFEPNVREEIPKVEGNSLEAKLVELLDGNPLTCNEMANRIQASPAQLVTLMTSLEIVGRVRRQPDGRFVKVLDDPRR